MTENTATAVRPLEGVRILDLTQAYSGPVCTMHLADMGAEVIKIEMPGVGDQTRTWEPIVDGNSGYYAYFNRNKLGISLNLKTDEGKEIFRKLVKQADVVCENYRVGTMERLGLGYESLKEINPGIIYASISGFGLEGPMAQRPCYDTVAQALGGMISMTGELGSEGVKVGPAIADSYSGTYLSLGICAALYQKEKTGIGRRIDVSMVDTVFSILETGAIQYTFKDIISKPNGNADPVVAPWDSFQAKDGLFIMACGTEKFWKTLCGAMGRPVLMTDPRFVTNADRVAHYHTELKPLIEEWSGKLTIDEVEEVIAGAGIPFGRIQNAKEACECELIKSRHMMWSVYDPAFGKDIQIPGTPIKLHGCEDDIRMPAPMIGQHNHDILKKFLGMGDEEISALEEKGVL